MMEQQAYAHNRLDFQGLAEYGRVSSLLLDFIDKLLRWAMFP